MPDIHIHRDHHLGFKEARKIAVAWAQKAEAKFDMDCTYEQGDTQDTLVFSRTGVKGSLLVDAHQFDMKAQLGFLLGAFKDRIESEIGNQLDALLSAPHAGAKRAASANTGKAKKATSGAASERGEAGAPANVTAKAKAKAMVKTKV